MDKKKLILGAAVTAFIAGATSIPQQAQAEETENCYGVNKCKGVGSCHGKEHSCAGNNKCAGKGWIKVLKGNCEKIKGGSLKPKK